MNLELQKFYRFILHGALFVASDYLIIWELFQKHFFIYNASTFFSFIIFLTMLAIISGVPIYWIYVVFWHFGLGEKKSMQRKEVRWFNNDIPLDHNNIHNYSNIIWHYLDSKEKHKEFSNWLRNNFLLIHSLGSSATALIIGFIIYLIIKYFYGYYQEPEIIVHIFWLLLFICILIYRIILKKRYMKRLEIFIKLNSSQILTSYGRIELDQDC